ncbi:virulence associated lipoprotein (plasmid) [Borrelia sp. CA_690]|uniref:Lipoprotein P35 n=1 Tax=Borrelia maritima TaxID=2761123 RepID=A0A5J6WCJ5_9SPIR|nr:MULTISPECIES: virulence associated lipoprotein [Borrelia]QFI15076.1 lipoprotein P35 [Borrelia maritima]WKC83943.1 virulence associated lipoprotein [Borrelia sp. CA_690]
MKYNIITGLFVFLFLACNLDSNDNQKDMRYQSSKKGLKSNKKGFKSNQETPSNQKEGHNKKTKNTMLNDLLNLIEKAHADKEKYREKLEKEPKEQYGISAFTTLSWADLQGEKISANTERSKKYRKHVYSILNTIDDNELKNFSKIITSVGQIQFTFNTLNALGYTLENMISSLYSKKDSLKEIEISSLEKVKNLFEKLLSTTSIVSKMMRELLLDYQNDVNSIKTDINKLKSHTDKIFYQMAEKSKKTEELKNNIFSIINNLSESMY